MDLHRYIKELRNEQAKVDKAIETLEALAVTEPGETPARGHRKGRTPEQRAAQGEKMRAYWAARKKANKKG